MGGLWRWSNPPINYALNLNCLKKQSHTWGCFFISNRSGSLNTSLLQKIPSKADSIQLRRKNTGFSMFYYLMISTFVLALGVSFMVMRLFSQSIQDILARIIQDPIHDAWAKYTKFAGMVVGTSSGIRIYDMEKYITPLTYTDNNKKIVIELTQERWVLEIYRTIIETLQGLAWMMLVFFMVALLAYVIVRWAEIKHQKP